MAKKKLDSGRQRWMTNQEGSDRSLRDRERLQRENADWAKFCEDDCERLLLPGQVWDPKSHQARDAMTIAEELQSARLFAVALAIEDPIAGTLRDLLIRVYDEWLRQDRPLVNYFSKKLSDAWYLDESLPKLPFNWHFLEPVADYDKPLLPPVDPLTKTKAKAAQSTENQGPTPYFSTKVFRDEGE
jgi:hypothetical protein